MIAGQIMTKSLHRLAAALVASAALAVPASAATPREMLTFAATSAADRGSAMTLVGNAIVAAQAQLAANPGDREARLQYAVGIGDRARLTKSPADARTARALFETYAAANPNDPEGQLAIASWHLDTVAAGFLATTVLGAKRDVGLAALNRSVALGQGHPFFPGFAAMMRIRLDPHDIAAARRLAEAAAAGTATTPLDAVAKRAAMALLVPLRAGDGKAAATLARRLLPFGRLDG